tara:strand:+ start:19776 stop:20075 length:300 start_codon:yes stop_codon:yes gene_type:complete
MVHRKTKNTRLFEYIKIHSKIRFEDNSWINDASDSVYNEEHAVSIYLPNADKKDDSNHECFTTFAISFVSHNEDTIKYDDMVFESVEDVVREINKIFKS